VMPWDWTPDAIQPENVNTAQAEEKVLGIESQFTDRRGPGWIVS